MDSKVLFEKNLLVLSQRNPELASRLAGLGAGPSIYEFLKSRSGEIIPARLDSNGKAHPLHSLMDPVKEARRLIDSSPGGFLVFLGLGAGHYAAAALEKDDSQMLLFIEYGIEGLAQLLYQRDYSSLFADRRFYLLVDPSGPELEQCILELYQPALYGGISVIPLRARTSFEQLFAQAGKTLEAAIGRVSADYSVQAHFGLRWFCNILKNLKHLEELQGALPVGLPGEVSGKRAAVTAAGPSLSLQIPQLQKRRQELFLIATDTSLPCLVSAGIKPDAVISIDCQHYSYYHFFQTLGEESILFLDLASPALLSSRCGRHCFFSGGHPLAAYVSLFFRPLSELDCSAGNVTAAAVSLAEKLGAREIELYGADYSYPLGLSYAKGAYIHSYFDARQNRLAPLEAQSSAFLYRTALDKKIHADGSWYYESKTMSLYRQRLEEKSAAMEAKLIPVEGMGAKITVSKHGSSVSPPPAKRPQSAGFGKAEDFLGRYKGALEKLASPGKNAAEYMASLDNEQRNILTGILPVAAALKKRQADWGFQQLILETKAYCIARIDSWRGVHTPSLQGGVVDSLLYKQ